MITVTRTLPADVPDVLHSICKAMGIVRADIWRRYGALGTVGKSANDVRKPKGRNWRCQACGFEGHRDIVGAVNMHPIADGQVVPFPKRITYLRPGSRRRSSSPDTGHRLDSSSRRCLAEARNQAPQDVCAGSLEHAHEPCYSIRSLPALAG